MWEIVTGSRLHFGLFQPATAVPGARRFGGAGMMIRLPGLRLRAERSAAWSATGPLASRVLSFAQTCARELSAEPLCFHSETAAPEHAGLGTGTQLGLAVAQLLALSASATPVDLAKLAGRGRRSGIGTHGFLHGGLLVDGGQGNSGIPAPLVARLPVPEDWCIVLAILPGGRDWYGRREQQAFAGLEGASAASDITDRLCRLTLLGLLPALSEGDLAGFGEALFELNMQAGSLFASAQGGTYASPEVARIVEFLRHLGIKGVGQSSWGPTVFAVVGDEEHANVLAERLRREIPLEADGVIVTKPLNEGAQVVDLVPDA